LQGTQKAVYLLRNNPWLFARKLAARANVLKPLPSEPFQRRLRGVVFEFDPRKDTIMWEAARNLYELEVVDLLRRLVPRGGVYLDVGANVGFLSAIAAGAVGPEGEVHGFEPVPRNFQKLQRLAELNPNRRIIANPCAIGDEEGTATMTVCNTENQGLHSIIPGMVPPEWVGGTITVPVRRLDRYISESVHRPVSFIKIDTEGFEFPVLMGLSGYLEREAQRPVILVEVTPAAWRRLGHPLSGLQDWIARYGYRAMNPLNSRAEVDVCAIREQENLLLMPSEG
jgi:FkbM family methyltransferase